MVTIGFFRPAGARNPVSMWIGAGIGALGA